MAQLPSAFSCHLSSVDSSDCTFGCTAKSTIVVVPPQAAAVVPVAKVSFDCVPPNGISMWVCTSMPPGRTYLPAASITESALAAHASVRPASGAARAAIFSPSINTSAAWTPVAETTLPPRIRMLIGYRLRSRSGQGVVRVGPPVAVEGPQVAYLRELVYVEVAYHDLFLGVGGRLADQLAARVHEVRLAVEVVVAQRFHADPVDRADVVLVGDRGRRLLQLPQVLGQAAAGGRRVEHDLRPGQAQCAPPLREVPLVADVDADPADRGVAHLAAPVAATEVELLPEPLDLRDVLLAVLAAVRPVGVDHRGGVVVDTGLLLLVHRDDEDDAVLARHVLHQLRGRPVRDRLGVRVVVRALHLAEVRPVEQLLQAHHLRALRGGGADRGDSVLDHGFLVAGPLLLHQTGANDLRH